MNKNEAMTSESPEEQNFPPTESLFDGNERKKLFLEKSRAKENFYLCEVGHDVIIDVEGFQFKAH